MRKTWLMCVLLGTVAWGQAAPSAPAPVMGGHLPENPALQQAPADQADTSASVAPDAAVITIIGVCSSESGTVAKTPAAETAAADCKTVITKAAFEKLIHNLTPNVTPQTKKQLAGLLPRLMALSAEARKKGLDQAPQFEDRVKFNKMQILAQELQQSIQDEAANVPPEEMEKYYKEHANDFEQFNLDRLFVPRTKQPDAEAKEDEKDGKLSAEAKKAKEAKEKAKADEAEQAMTKLAETLRVRAAAGEDIAKLQKEAFEAAGMKIASPTVNLPSVRRTALQAAHAAVFDLKPGEVSQVINDAGGHYIYKMNSESELTLDQAKNEIHGKLQNDRTREMMDKVNNSFKVETNDSYFGPGGAAGAAQPPRPPRQRLPTPGQQQTPPPAQPPAAKPN